MSRNLGGGGGPRSMMVYEVQDLLVIKKEYLINRIDEIEPLFNIIAKQNLLPFIQDLKNNEVRKSLDSIVFDTLDLTGDERDSIYEATINYIEGRLKKADSLNINRHM